MGVISFALSLRFLALKTYRVKGWVRVECYRVFGRRPMYLEPRTIVFNPNNGYSRSYIGCDFGHLGCQGRVVSFLEIEIFLMHFTGVCRV